MASAYKPTETEAQMVGEIARDELYSQTLMIRGILRAAIECVDSGNHNNGLYECLQVAERMADQLSANVSP